MHVHTRALEACLGQLISIKHVDFLAAADIYVIGGGKDKPPYMIETRASQ
jgi:hypothetical protein